MPWCGQLLVAWLAVAGQLLPMGGAEAQLAGSRREKRQEDLYLEHMYSHYLQQEGRYHSHPQAYFSTATLQNYRRRVNTNEKAKVVAAFFWGGGLHLFNSLPR